MQNDSGKIVDLYLPRKWFDMHSVHQVTNDFIGLLNSIVLFCCRHFLALCLIIARSSATNQLIAANDHAAVQINIAKVRHTSLNRV